MRRSIVMMLLAAAGISGAACDNKGPIEPGTLFGVTVTPDPQTMIAGSTQQFSATGKDTYGTTMAVSPTWAVAANGGTINATGLFTAGRTLGTFTKTVVATSGVYSGAATVIIINGPLATLTLTPVTITMAAGTTQQYTTVGTDAFGNVVAVPSPTYSVVAGGGSINSTSGLFTAGGTAGGFANTVKVTSGTLSATATVNVTPGATASITLTPSPANVAIGATQQYTTVGKDASGNIVTVTPVYSVVANGGTISSTGLFTAGATAGTFTNTVKSTVGTLSATATVTVTGSLATITVSPNPASVAVNATQQFTAVGTDANGNIVTITPVWSVTNGGGTISANGLFTAGANTGAFANTVRATSGTLNGTATVNVTSGQTQNPIVDLGAAGPNGIMAGTAVSCVNLGAVNADVSISPGNTLTGFGPCTISGTRHLNDASAVAAQLALTNAYNTLAGLPCPPANIISANLGGTTKAAGVYCSASSLSVSGTLTLDGGGDPNATFVFQAGSSLTTAGNIVLINGAQAKNVFWQVGSSATLGTASQFQGNILALTSISLIDNATLTGRALARNGAVSLTTGNVIILP